jgi:hypothetical protein
LRKRHGRALHVDAHPNYRDFRAARSDLPGTYLAEMPDKVEQSIKKR